MVEFECKEKTTLKRNIIVRRVCLLQTREKKLTETKKQPLFLANQAKIQSNSNEQKSAKINSTKTKIA